MKSLKFARSSADLRFAALVGFLVVVFLTGGGSRADIQSLPLLRPLSVLVCAAAAATLSAEKWRAHRSELMLVVAMLALILAHAVPLPPAVWHQLPGRELLVSADAASGMLAQWRPLSIYPDATWNGIYALFTPLAVFLLAIGLNDDRLRRLLPVLIFIGIASGLLGILQVLGAPNGPLYTYRIHSVGTATGLFANRNHAAFFLAILFPMLACFAMSGKTANAAKARLWLALVGGVLLIPIILVAGSRLGLGLALINLIGAVLLYREPTGLRRIRRHVNPIRRYLAIAAAIAAIASVSFVMSRATAVNRLFTEAVGGDLRFSIWAPSLTASKAFFPWGSGLGTFVEAFAIFEPEALLGPAYINHAHNDFIEILLTGGVPATALLIIGLAMLSKWAWAAWRGMRGRTEGEVFPVLGALVAGSLVLGSVFDYPLRTPALASVLAIAIAWLRIKRVGANRETP